MQLHDRLYTGLVQTALLPLGDRLFGQRMMARLALLRQAQWWDAARLIAHRDGALRQVVRTVYDQVPYYKQAFDDARVRPDDVRTAADLQRLPLLTKTILRAHPIEQFTRPTGQSTYDSCSSGSTGAPLCVREDADTAGWYRASFMLALDWMGWTPGLPHLQTGMSLKRSRGRWLKDVMLRCHYVSAYDLTDAHLDSILDRMEKHKIDFLMGYPGSLYYLARRAAQRGWSRPLIGAATWGDNLYAHYRQAIERAFQTRVTDTYGIGEGVQVAAQCGQGMHYHIHSLDTIVEYLDDAGAPVPIGQVGNLVVTRLHAGPMPLIRYQVGDIGISGGWRRCACGRGFEIMESVQGRDTDVITTPSGNRLIVHFFTGILEYFPQIEVFQVRQEQPDAVRLLIVPTADYTAAIGETILSQLREMGADIAIAIELVDAIPTAASGKRRFVINTLAQSTAATQP